MNSINCLRSVVCQCAKFNSNGITALAVRTSYSYNPCPFRKHPSLPCSCRNWSNLGICHPQQKIPLLQVHDKLSWPPWTQQPSNVLIQFFCTQSNADKSKNEPPKALDSKAEKLPLWEKFKKMYKEYWYVLVPVHLVTSTVWYGSFYYIARSGVDIVPLLENLGASETILKPLRDTGAGYFAVAYGMYKIATPARYTITLGGTTITINYLKKWGYIKPMPSGEQMKEMIREKGRQLRSQRARVLAKMNLRRKGSTKSKTPEPPTKS